MRVVIAHNRYRSAAPSGENRVVDTESQALAGLGHEVIRFERDSDEIGRWPAYRKATLPARVLWSRRARTGLSALLREHRPDLVHVHNTFPLLSASVLYACRDAGVPVVATIHNYKLACAGGEFFRDGAVCHDCAGGLPVPAVRHACYRGSRAATVPVALSIAAHRQAWRSLVSAYMFISAAERDLLRSLELPPERVFVRHNLIPADLLPLPAAGSGHAGEPGPARGPTIVYAGRLDAAKGARLLMAGWDAYTTSREEPGLRLIVAGAGPLGGEVAAWAATRPSVAMAGLRTRAECMDLMSRALAVVLPSQWEETFGLAAVEAMAAGAIPVASAHGSFPELIGDGTDGVLFRPGDPAALGRALAGLEDDPGGCAALSAHARQTYEKRFSKECNLRQLEEIYRYAISHPA
jgi:glycosyltransferase involved in cell wall biosynthesis